MIWLRKPSPAISAVAASQPIAEATRSSARSSETSLLVMPLKAYAVPAASVAMVVRPGVHSPFTRSTA